MEIFNFLKKWPTWLRWILALPMAALFSVIFKFLTIISLNLTGLDTSSFWGTLVLTLYDATMGIIVFVFLIASIVPSYKLITAIAVSIVYGIIHIIIATLGIVNQSYILDSLVVNIIYYIVTVISFIFACVSVNKSIEDESESESNISA